MKAQGTSGITEQGCESRVMLIGEWRRMNCNEEIEGRRDHHVDACDEQGDLEQQTDRRAAAALILAGLSSEGQSEGTELKHLDRGYVNFTGKLQKLGANIERITEKEEAPNVEEISKK